MSGPSGGALTRHESEAARLSLALGRISRWIRRQHFLPLGQGAVSALATIAREGPIRLGDLAVKEGVAPASLSRIVTALVADGLVVRRSDPDDGRSCQVSATPVGEQLLAQLRATTARVVLDRLDRLDPEHRSAVIAALPALEAMAAEEQGPGAHANGEMLAR